MTGESGAIKKGDTQQLLAASEISLMLDTYDDIFSDFDPRHYDRRALSDDFLQEAKKAARDKDGTVELRFLISQTKRNTELETVIRQRLHNHFKRHAELLAAEVRQTKRKGLLMTFLGTFMIVVASYLSSLASEQFFINFLIIVLQPAGWFTAWTGMDEIYYTVREQKPDIDFYHKMTHATILFTPY